MTRRKHSPPTWKLRDVTSPFSYTTYLHTRGLLEQGLIFALLFIPRQGRRERCWAMLQMVGPPASDQTLSSTPFSTSRRHKLQLFRCFGSFLGLMHRYLTDQGVVVGEMISRIPKLICVRAMIACILFCMLAVHKRNSWYLHNGMGK